MSSQPRTNATPRPVIPPTTWAPGKLRTVKLLHTVVWVLFAGCTVAIPILALMNMFIAAAVASSIMLFEVAVLMCNQFRCPLTDMAARYTDDRRDNFDIYLPEWLARHNKTIFGTLYAVGMLFAFGRWMLVR
ncbi:MAG: hypothetical protein K0R39_3380 [Symbiobacteriaceae bacterium]|jgi:hypothetical protein|nr:hypothetical protein [Symbiobacteriaceae bacterium]